MLPFLRPVVYSVGFVLLLAAGAEGADPPQAPKARAEGPESRPPRPDPVAQALPKKTPRRHVFFVSTSS